MGCKITGRDLSGALNNGVRGIREEELARLLLESEVRGSRDGHGAELTLQCHWQNLQLNEEDGRPWN
jgi:hypothetical protein